MNILNEKIFDFVFELALRDAMLRNSNKGELKEFRKNKELKQIVKRYINKIINGSCEDGDFWDAALNIQELLRDKFTFGKAQKLINMTAKYCYIMSYNVPNIKPRFASCHCPMDNYMINHIIKNSNHEWKKGEKSKLRESWSKMTYDGKNKLEQYILFQSLLKELADNKGVSPIEFDYLAWNPSSEE